MERCDAEVERGLSEIAGEIPDLTSAALARFYKTRQLSPVEVAKEVFARIDKHRAVNAFLPLKPESALAAAQESEVRWKDGKPLSAIDGVPLTVKDTIMVRGMTTFRGSKTGDRSVASEDAPAVARLREQGAVVIGKTTTPEHGWIGVCHSPLTGITRNPWNLDRTTGGSSGGAAAAALLNLGVFHLGTDGAGSLRIPAAFTGVVGFKPTYGRVPLWPASALLALSHHGPITRTVGETAAMMSVISGPDLRDMKAWNAPPEDFSADLDKGVRGLRVALSLRLGGKAYLDPEVEAAVRRSAQALAEQGALIEEADPDVKNAGELIRILWTSTAANIVDSVPESDREMMDPGFLKIAAAGRRIPAAAYIGAYIARAPLYAAMLAFHRRYDLLLSPTMPVTAFDVGFECPPGDKFSDAWLSWSPFTYPFNLTGQPAVSVPAGLSREGLPIGVQIVGPARGDVTVLRAARALERAQPFPVPEAYFPATRMA